MFLPRVWFCFFVPGNVRHPELDSLELILGRFKKKKDITGQRFRRKFLKFVPLFGAFLRRTWSTFPIVHCNTVLEIASGGNLRRSSHRFFHIYIYVFFFFWKRISSCTPGNHLFRGKIRHFCNYTYRKGVCFVCVGGGGFILDMPRDSVDLAMQNSCDYLLLEETVFSWEKTNCLWRKTKQRHYDWSYLDSFRRENMPPFYGVFDLGLL